MCSHFESFSIDTTDTLTPQKTRLSPGFLNSESSKGKINATGDDAYISPSRVSSVGGMNYLVCESEYKQYKSRGCTKATCRRVLGVKPNL